MTAVPAGRVYTVLCCGVVFLGTSWQPLRSIRVAFISLLSVSAPSSQTPAALVLHNTPSENIRNTAHRLSLTAALLLKPIRTSRLCLFRHLCGCWLPVHHLALSVPLYVLVLHVSPIHSTYFTVSLRYFVIYRIKVVSSISYHHFMCN